MRETKYRRTIEDLNSFEIAGTGFDRRRKFTDEEMQYIKYLYEHKKELNIKVKDIAKAFDIHEKNVWRYVDRKSYLESCRLANKKHRDLYGTKSYKNSSLEYKDKLLDLIELGIPMENIGE